MKENTIDNKIVCFNCDGTRFVKSSDQGDTVIFSTNNSDVEIVDTPGQTRENGMVQIFFMGQN